MRKFIKKGPKIVGRAELLYAPYVHNVTIYFEDNIFTNLENIETIEIIVGNGVDCCM
jgi:hypothetical protein